jgi:hypothetical protein
VGSGFNRIGWCPRRLPPTGPRSVRALARTEHPSYSTARDPPKSQPVFQRPSAERALQPRPGTPGQGG